VTAAKKIEKSVPVVDKERSEPLGCLGNRHSGCVRGIRAARSVVEQNRSEWTLAGGLPEERFEAQIAAWYLGELPSD